MCCFVCWSDAIVLHCMLEVMRRVLLCTLEVVQGGPRSEPTNFIVAVFSLQSATDASTSFKLLNGRDRRMSMFSIRPSIIRHVTRDSLRSFATVHKDGVAPSPTRPRGWTPTPYVTETIVRDLLQFRFVIKANLSGRSMAYMCGQLTLGWKEMLTSCATTTL